ncbi:MAG: hypothetical protein ACJ71W_06000 [Terriglobales bacterium]
MAGLGILKKAFPFIEAAASAGGPFAVMAAQAVGKAIGAEKVDPTPDGIAKAIQDAGFTSEQRTALMQHEADLKQELAKLGYQTAEDLTKLDNDDRASARARQIALKDATPTILAVFVVVAWGLIQRFLLTHVVPPAMIQIVARVLGTLDAALMMVLSYYFGSSAGSAKKTELLAQQGQQQQN